MLDTVSKWVRNIMADPETILYVVTALALFGPIITTVLFTFVSGFMWLLWMIVSISFSIVQLIYVMYQFIMISVDVGGIIVLKTFATIRTVVLYFGLHIRWLWRKGWNFGGEGDEKKERVRSRRKWRIEINSCHSYEKYAALPIDEPKISEPDEHPMTAMNAIRVSQQQFISNLKIAEKILKRQAIRGLRSLHLIGKRKEGNMGRRRISRSRSEGNKSDTSLDTLAKNGIVSRKSLASASLRHSMSSGNLMREPMNNPSTDLLGITGEMLTTTTGRLREARENEDIKSLQHLLIGIVKRNHLGIDDIMNENSRGVAECGRNQLPSRAIDTIIDYMEEVIECLEWMTDPETFNVGKEEDEFDKNDDPNAIKENNRRSEESEVKNRHKILRKLKQNTGCSALMLSGGGAITMYHMGVVKALIESGVYEHIPVVSGTSGGSITAAMCAINTPDELLNEVCVNTVSTDYPVGTGIMKRDNIRWFPKAMDMATYWLKHKRLVDSKEFKRTCDHYYGTTTFEEAFQKTGKHVCIHVSASRAGAGGGTQKLLLNHISTPHVTIASAVAASCALPGVMNPTSLYTKDSDGHLEPFAVDGVEWIDGSVQADLPFRRISTLFNASHFIVSQVNFHVVPLLNKAHHPSVHTTYWKMFQMLEWDIRSRALNLSRLGLFPKIFGQDISKIFKQKYHGNITIVPRFTKMSAIGLNALLNPTVEDMTVYIQNGQVATWPYVEAIKHNLRIEQALNSCVASLENIMGESGLKENFDRKRSERDTIKSSKVINALQADNDYLRDRIRHLEEKLKDAGIDLP